MPPRYSAFQNQKSKSFIHFPLTYYMQCLIYLISLYYSLQYSFRFSHYIFSAANWKQLLTLNSQSGLPRYITPGYTIVPLGLCSPHVPGHPWQPGITFFAQTQANSVLDIYVYYLELANYFI